ncbi:hypothetical protein ACHAXS_009006 [Conticribra weissflogii]
MAKIGKKLLRVGSGGRSTKRNPTAQVQNENREESSKTKRFAPNKNKEIDNNIKLKQDIAKESKSSDPVAPGCSDKSPKNNLITSKSKPPPQSPQEKSLRNQKPRSKQSDILQLTNSLAPSESQPFRDDDEQTIGRLEKECNRLSYTIKKFPKYSHEWFFLDSKLTAAKQELEAAYEDRNLVLDFGLDENNVKSDENSVGGGTVPKTIHFNFQGDGENDDKIPTQQNQEAVEPLSDAVYSPPSDLSDITSEQETKISHKKMPLNQQCDLLHDNERSKEESERIARLLSDVPKFSPEWFQLKEEYLDFLISLQEADNYDNPLCEAGDGLLKKGPDAVESDDVHNVQVKDRQHTTNEMARCERPQQTDDVPNHNDTILQHNHRAEDNFPTDSTVKVLSEEDLRDLDIELPYNITSNRVPSFALSPSSSTAGSTSSSINQRSLSPPLSPPTSPILGRQLFPPLTPPDVVIARSTVAGSYYYGQDEEGNIDDVHVPIPLSMQQQQHQLQEQHQLQSKNTESLERMTRLKAEHAAACVKLGSFPKFSEPWFAAKTNVVLLEDQMDDFENATVSGGCGRSISGWSHFSSVSAGGGVCDSDRSASSSGWSDHEDESMSLGNEFGDVLERVMVVEALKQGNCISPIDGNEHGIGNDQNLSPVQINIPRVENSVTVNQESAATLIQTHWRRYIYSNKLHHSIKSIILIQRNGRKHIYWRKFRAKKSSCTTIQSYIRMKIQKERFRQLVSSTTAIQKAARTFLARNQKKKVLSSKILIPQAALVTPSRQSSKFMRSLESPQFISKSLLSPSGERSRLNVRVKRHKWLSLKLVHVKKYSDEWFETIALLREMKEEIEMLQKISDDNNSHRQSSEQIISTQINDDNGSGNLVLDAKESVNNSYGRVTGVVKSMERSKSPGQTNADKRSSGAGDACELHQRDFNPCGKEKRLKQTGLECIQLSKRMTSLPKFSSEWFQSKAKLDAATKELEALYVESMQTELGCSL